MVFHTEFWYSVEHVVFHVKTGFAPGEFGFWENQFDKKTSLFIVISYKKMLNINYILMASVDIRQLNQIYSQVIEKRYSAYFGNINEYYTISFRVF